MAFPFPKSLGGVIRTQATNTRRIVSAHDMGLSSVQKGAGSFDVLNGSTVEAAVGDLPDGSQGLGARIGGTLVNLATWAKAQVDSLSDRITAEKNRNDSQDSTLTSHGTRLTNVETKNTTQDGRLTALENAMGGAASGSALSALTARVGLLIDQVDALEAAFKSQHPGVLP